MSNVKYTYDTHTVVFFSFIRLAPILSFDEVRTIIVSGIFFSRRTNFLELFVMGSNSNRAKFSFRARHSDISAF